jgi:hypothetical protein
MDLVLPDYHLHKGQHQGYEGSTAFKENYYAILDTCFNTFSKDNIFQTLVSKLAYLIAKIVLAV